jgi:6-phosphofructokinase
LLKASIEERDASGNLRLKDIGPFLREKIESYFKAERIPVVMRYFDPSYQVRSRPANCEDALLCDLFARHAVHAAMAGKTGVVIGFLHERFIHVRIELLATLGPAIVPRVQEVSIDARVFAFMALAVAPRPFAAPAVFPALATRADLSTFFLAADFMGCDTSCAYPAGSCG